jgi:hypothetical protein
MRVIGREPTPDDAMREHEKYFWRDLGHYFLPPTNPRAGQTQPKNDWFMNAAQSPPRKTASWKEAAN